MGIDALLKKIAPALLLAAIVAPAGAQEATAKRAPQAPRVIDLAICLDTSNSMDGLIDSARRKIWAIVNDLALAKPTPRLRVALLSYGNQGYDKDAGWVRVDTQFTEDLDLVSKQLFGLTTNGGTELVGRVLQRSLASLDWQKDPEALKLIVVSGNESADQDRAAPFRDMCRAAIARGIMINSIYCTRNENVVDTWREIARLSDGHFAAIDQNKGTVDITSPFDTQLAALSKDLNKTYVAFGTKGREGRDKQQRADKDAEKLEGGAAASRANAKSSTLYWNSWCLVDALERKTVDLAKMKKEDLPKIMQTMTIEEQQKYLDGKREARTKIQARIQDLHKQRQVWLQKELAKRAVAGDKSFDSAVRKALRTQAAAKGYTFEG